MDIVSLKLGLSFSLDSLFFFHLGSLLLGQVLRDFDFFWFGLKDKLWLLGVILFGFKKFLSLLQVFQQLNDLLVLVLDLVNAITLEVFQRLELTVEVQLELEDHVFDKLNLSSLSHNGVEFKWLVEQVETRWLLKLLSNVLDQKLLLLNSPVHLTHAFDFSGEYSSLVGVLFFLIGGSLFGLVSKLTLGDLKDGHFLVVLGILLIHEVLLVILSSSLLLFFNLEFFSGLFNGVVIDVLWVALNPVHDVVLEAGEVSLVHNHLQVVLKSLQLFLKLNLAAVLYNVEHSLLLGLALADWVVPDLNFALNAHDGL